MIDLPQDWSDWFNVDRVKNTCARCGGRMLPSVYINNIMKLTILTKEIQLHFCNRCFEIVNKKERMLNAIYRR
jgi:hypothetical protein